MGEFRIGRKHARHVYPDRGAPGAISPFDAPWTEVIAPPGSGTFVFAAQPGQRKFLVDTATNKRPVEIDLAALPAGAVVIVVDWGGGNGGTSSLNNIDVKAPAGLTIGNPSAAGAQAALAVVASDGADVWWQVIATSAGNQLVQIVGG